MARVSPHTGGSMAEAQQILCPICHKPNLRRARFCQHCGSDVALNNDGPRYYITRVIKEGGQGAVYETIGDDNQIYAVKEMLDRFTDPKERAEAIDRFETEAELLQRLAHPRIPKIYAHFKDEGRHYLAMDFVRGEDLEQVLDRAGAQPEARVLELADQICDVMDYLHRHGLIYRDMKPSNVMIEQQSGGVKLIDFGIAKVFQPTQRGTQIGTPGYAPPEQYQGFATVESDIYALGATLHHLLTGRDPREEKPFTFPDVRSIKPEVSQRTAAAVARALEWKADDRYHSVAELRASLRPQAEPRGQIRRAPAIQPLPAQPQTAAPQPAARPAAPAPQPVPAQPTRPPAQPVPRAQPQPAPAQRARRGGFLGALWRFVRNLLVLTVVLVLIAATLIFAFPDQAAQYLPTLPFGQLENNGQQLTTRQETLSVTVIVPTGSDEQAIRQALLAGFRQQAQQTFGSSTVVNEATVAQSGPLTKVSDNPDGTTTYQASVGGFISAP